MFFLKKNIIQNLNLKIFKNSKNWDEWKIITLDKKEKKKKKKTLDLYLQNKFKIERKEKYDTRQKKKKKDSQHAKHMLWG